MSLTIYKNYLLKFFDTILLNDASHFTKGGKPIDFNVDKNDEIIKNPEKGGEQLELKVVAPCRN